MLSIVTGTT